MIVEQRELLSRLRAVVAAKDAENQVLRAELDAARERERRLGLRLAELERRLRMDSTDSGTPASKEPIGAGERRRAERQESERERRKDRRRGGQPGHPSRANGLMTRQAHAQAGGQPPMLTVDIATATAIGLSTRRNYLSERT